MPQYETLPGVLKVLSLNLLYSLAGTDSINLKATNVISLVVEQLGREDK
jgi:hypothetical protein